VIDVGRGSISVSVGRGSVSVSVNRGSNRVSRASDVRVKSVVSVSGVVHGTRGAISLEQTVVALHHVTITSLALALLVARVCVGNAVLEGVLGCRLLHKITVNTAEYVN
jgi:hypothetical protein